MALPVYRFRPSISTTSTASLRRSYPSKDSAPPQPHRVTTAVALLAFPSHRVRPSGWDRFQFLRFERRQVEASPTRLCSARGSVPSIAVFPRPLACPSWALFLFKVLRPSRGKPRSGGRPPAQRESPSNRGTIRVAPVPLFEEPRTRRGFVERRSVLFHFVIVPTSESPRSTFGPWPLSRRTRGHSRGQGAPSTAFPRPKVCVLHGFPRRTPASCGAHPRGSGPSLRSLGSSASMKRVHRAPEDEPARIPPPFSRRSKSAVTRRFRSSP